MKDILIDTNAYSHLYRGNKDVFEIIAKASRVNLSSIVIGELFSGFKNGSGKNENRDILGRFSRKPTVRILDGGFETASIYGSLQSALKTLGRPIPTNDVWIASQCIKIGTTFIMFDCYSERISGLKNDSIKPID